MIRFNSDYTEGCHTAILEKLVETNMEQTAGYGEDEYCGQARELIRKACGDERVDWWRSSTYLAPISIPILLRHQLKYEENGL